MSGSYQARGTLPLRDVPDFRSAQAEVAGEAWRHTMQRTTHTSVGPSDGVKAAQTSRLFYVNQGRSGICALKLRYANTLPFGAANPATVTMTASVEVNPAISDGSIFYTQDANIVLLPVTFRGQRTATMSPGATIESDPLFVYLKAGQAIYVRSYGTATGGNLPMVQGIRSARVEGINNSYASVTAATGTGSATVNFNLGAVGFTLPIVPGQMRLIGGPITTAVVDNGSGAFSGTGISSGTINYTTGDVSLTLSSALANGVALVAFGYGGANLTPTDLTTVTGRLDQQGGRADYFGGAYQLAFGPVAIVGISPPSVPAKARGRAIGIFGDSIVAGTGNANDYLGMIEYCGAGQIGFCKLAQPGEGGLAFAQLGSRFRRLQAMRGEVDRVVGNYATNDAVGGATLPQIQAMLLSIWAEMAMFCREGAAGVFWVASIPRTINAGSQTPYMPALFGPGTVASGSPSLRNALNAWLFTRVGKEIAGVLDLNLVLEETPDSQNGAGNGRWANLAHTSDGVHLTLLAHQTAIPARFGLAGTDPHPLFKFG